MTRSPLKESKELYQLCRAPAKKTKHQLRCAGQVLSARFKVLPDLLLPCA